MKKLNPAIYVNAKATVLCPSFQCPPEITKYLQFVFDGEYDVPVAYTDEAPVVLDLGANYGAFSVWASHRWPGCIVHAYEPHPETFEVLSQNLSLYPKVTAYNHAIGNPGLRVLHDGLGNSGECSLYVPENNLLPTGQHVEVKDPLTLPEARILKMDIEGCEIEVLEPLLAQGRIFDAVMFEYHRTSDRRILDSLLKDYTLTGANLYNPGLGVMRYVHKKLLGG